MNSEKKYDLEERTAKFSEEIIKFCQDLKLNTVSKPIVSQLVRSASSMLRMLKTCFPEKTERLRVFWKEAQELTMIFQKITNSLRK